jgi:hypothetical protein
MVSTQLEAEELVKKELEEILKAFISRVIRLNESRHSVILTDIGNFYILFKREFFMSFGMIFNESGAGESCNEDFLDKAIEYKANLLFVYPDGKIYTISSMLFKKLSQENNWIRETASKEKTYSIPVRYLTRWGAD